MSTVPCVPRQPRTRDLVRRRPIPAPAATPYLALDVEAAVNRYRELSLVLPGTAVHYAVKANPHPGLLAGLATAGCRFDVASPAEVGLAIGAGARPRDLVYSNPIKRRDDVASAHTRGVRLFVVDSPDEARKVAAEAPGASVLCRLLTSGAGSDWPLSRKYGCSTAEAVRILRLAASLGLDPAGTAFHVGSQQRDPGAWSAPVQASADAFSSLRSEGLRPWLLDLGGGFPAEHEGGHPGLAAYGTAIGSALTASFGADVPETLVEPGRGLVGDAGTLVATVIAVVHRSGTRWVFLDAGVFTGLVETLDEAIRYRITTSADGVPTAPAVLAGPTCDSADVLYQDVPVQLPVTLTEGDTVRLHSAGAYTSSYSTVGFNGFAPLTTQIVG